MGSVLPFPKRDAFASTTVRSEPAYVYVLPVVRIERNPDEPADAPGRRRRRRSSRIKSCANCAVPIPNTGNPYFDGICPNCAHVHGGLVLKEL